MRIEDFDPQPAPEIPQRPVKGRGAAGNVVHRFSNETRQAEDDGWEHAEPSLPQTRLLVDSAKSISIRQRFELACRRHDLSRELPALDTSRFRPPGGAGG